ncbi:hypothetical protein PY479_05165 [Shewanella sp. A32]|uniref:hypothetical protein n=1 Tax=Shewanella sp. A32 TaxID=3031327 RepID=UPI0023B88945|nr:hypothetical protein [Shewanella sp. A32]MDF0533669.1 hypothetical protein [Shewanella sp. A32]
MTITREDLKIFKPELLGSADDAGGQRTKNAVVSGELNELFKAISDIDHAVSTVDIVKCFPALDTAGTETLLDGHIFISQPPTDPLVSWLIAESSSLTDASRMKDMVDIFESSVRAGQLIRRGLIGLLAGQDSFPRPYLQSMYTFNDIDYWNNVTLQQGQIICISVEYAGNEDANYPRFEHFCQMKATVTGGINGQVLFSPPIPYDTPDADVEINGERGCTKLRYTSVNDDIKYHGVTKLAAPNSGTLIEVDNTTSELLPKVRQVAVHSGMSLQALGTSDVPTNAVKKTLQQPIAAGQYTYIFEVPDILNTDFVNKVLGLKPSASGISSRYSVSITITGTTATVTFSPILISGAVGFVAYDVVTLEYLSSARYTYFESSSGALPSTSKITVGTVVMSITITSSSSVLVLSEQSDGFYANGRKYVELDYTDGTITKYPDSNGDFTVEYECLIEPGLPEDNAVVFNLGVAEPILDTFYCTISTADGNTLLSASADSNGDITGTGVTGTIVGKVVSMSFTQDVDLTTLRYDISEITTITPPPELYGLNPLRLPSGGVVPIFTAWTPITVEDTAVQVVSNPTIGATYNVRTAARFVDITDATGASLWTVDDAHYSHNTATGVVTINSDFSGFTAPFVLTDSIGEQALVTDVQDGKLQLSAPLANDYPVGAIVASVQNLGDLQAYVGPVRDMTAWANNWDQDGAAATGSLNVVDNPIEVFNNTSINEDWVLIFTSSTAFRCVGKNIGQIATGDTLNDFAPINPLTQAPYFVIRQGAFGGGWNTGEAIRFATFAASKPVMLLRSVASGHSEITTDRAILAFRGNES